MKRILIVASVILLFVIPGKSQCDLKLKDRLTKEIEQDGYALIKDLDFELDESGSTQCRMVLQKGFPYRFYLGLSEKYPSEVDLYITAYLGKDTVTGLILDKETMTLDFRPTNSGVYVINSRLKRGVKSCGVILLTYKKRHKVGTSKPLVPNDSTAYLVVDEMPQFIEGDDMSFRNWLKQKETYPEVARKKGIQGKLFVQFTVDKEGNVANVKVIKGTPQVPGGVDPALDPEVNAYVVNLIKSCPKWQKPGKLQNKAVKVLYMVPVILKLK